MRLELGSPVQCTDGPFGEVADVVVDPTKRRLTHLVVEPHDDQGPARLVPIELVSAQEGPSPAVSLRCTLEEAGRLEPVREFAYIRLGESPKLEPGWEMGVESVLAEPAPSPTPPSAASATKRCLPTTTRTCPRNLRPNPQGRGRDPAGERCHLEADGHHVGEVDGFLVGDDDAITHFVLERGHLWGRREVTIPINAVAQVFTDAVTLTLTKDEVGELPAVRVHRWLG